MTLEALIPTAEQAAKVLMASRVGAMKLHTVSGCQPNIPALSVLGVEYQPNEAQRCASVQHMKPSTTPPDICEAARAGAALQKEKGRQGQRVSRECEGTDDQGESCDGREASVEALGSEGVGDERQHRRQLDLSIIPAQGAAVTPRRPTQSGK
eukprot:156250-Rhodomonas_salina.3